MHLVWKTLVDGSSNTEKYRQNRVAASIVGTKEISTVHFLTV